MCVFGTGSKYKNYDAHHTGIALYLQVSNKGVVATSIKDVRVGYHWAISPFDFLNWIRYRIGWFYLLKNLSFSRRFPSIYWREQKGLSISTSKKLFLGESVETFLEPGRTTNGVVYFEQTKCFFGGCFPLSKKFKTKIKIVVSDAFGNNYSLKTKVDRVKLSDARVYNPKFGTTLSELHGSSEPIELETDSHGQSNSTR